MLKKLIYFLIFYIFLLSLSQILAIAGYLTGKSVETNNIIKNIGYTLLQVLYESGFKSPIYYNGKYDMSDKIDIITTNH